MQQPSQEYQELIIRDLQRLFGNSLTPDQHRVAAEIFWEVVLSVADKQTSFDDWQIRVTTLQQDWKEQAQAATLPAELNTAHFAQLWLQWVAGDITKEIFQQSPTLFYEEGIKLIDSILAMGEIDTAIKIVILWLCYNAGLTQGQLKQPEKELKLYQQGLDYAINWLIDLTPEAKGRVLSLINNKLSIYYASGQTAQVIDQLPYLGFWTWIAFHDSEEEHKRTHLHNWKNYLNIQFVPAHFTAAFQDFLYTLLTDYHHPEKSQRPFTFITTDILFKLSESLYSLDQAQDNQRLRLVYEQLSKFDDLDCIITAQRFEQKAKKLQQQKEQLSQTNGLFRSVKQWFLTGQQHDLNVAIEQQRQMISDSTEWKTACQSTETALIDWLRANCETHLKLSPQYKYGIEELPHVILALLFISHSASPEETLIHWQTQSPWQTVETLKSALTTTYYQQWLNPADPEKQKQPLYVWENSLKEHYPTNNLLIKLTIYPDIINQDQPTIRDWLRQPEPLLDKLRLAWQNLQQRAKPLAALLAAFETEDFPQNIASAITKNQPSHYSLAITTLILGNLKNILDNAIKSWLEQTKLSDDGNILEILATYKHRFSRAINIYSKTHHHLLAQQTYKWANVLLQDSLQVLSVPVISNYWGMTSLQNIGQSHSRLNKIIWEILERSRISLHNIALKLPEDWETKLGEELWDSLDLMVKAIDNGYKPADDEMLPPLQTWLEYFDNKLHRYQSLDWKNCHQRLQTNEALIQPFFDNQQQTYRLLWLDKNNGLSLLYLPDNCRAGSWWENEEKTGVIDQWEQALALPDNDSCALMTTLSTNSAWVTCAEYLAETAKQRNITQLITIFPAPLGQLPWEALPALENLLIRAVSISQWYDEKILNESGEYVLGMGNLTKLNCCNSEAAWIAKQWQTTATLPTKTIETFDILHQLANQRRVYLSTHGSFNPYNPLNSGLLLGHLQNRDKDGKSSESVDLPLWLCSAIKTPCELLILSACESNLTGRRTAGILSPLGIAPSFIAAGAHTVIGTLWNVKDITTLYFFYYFFTIAQENPQLPWHQIMTQARHKLRHTTQTELKKLAKELNIENNSRCEHGLNALIHGLEVKPFDKFKEWGAFTVCGDVTHS